MKVTPFLLCAALLGMAFPASARTKSHTPARAVQLAAKRYFAGNPPAVGLSIGIYRRGQTFTYNFGRVEPGKPGAPTADTLYTIASISKTMTGAVLAKAVVAGRVKLDDDVRRYLDGDYPNLAFDGHPIRLFDLLDHRSGLPNMLPDRPELQPGSDVSKLPWTARLADAQKTWRREEFIAALHDVKLTAAPGKYASYSNAGAILAGYALERVYGMPFEQLARRQLFDPLGMSDTAITLTSRQAARVAPGYDDRGARMPPVPPLMQGAAGFKSSVNDMLRYVRWGVTERDAAARLSHEPVAIALPADTKLAWPYAAGLNWQELITKPDGKTRRLIWQTGGIDGYFSICIEEPELGLGLVILTNQKGAKSEGAAKAMANDILRALDNRAVLML